MNRFELKTTNLKFAVNQASNPNPNPNPKMNKRKDVKVKPATSQKKSLAKPALKPSASTPSSISLTTARKERKISVSGRAAEAEHPMGQPSKLFLLLLNSNATLIQRWWRSLQRNAPSLNPSDSPLSLAANNVCESVDPVQEEQDEVTKKRRQAIAEQARLEVLRELERENTKILKESAAHIELEETNNLAAVQIAAAAEPSEKEEKLSPSNIQLYAGGSDVVSQPKQEESAVDLTISYTNSETAKDQDFLIDYEIQIVNDYYNHNSIAAVDDYEEDFEEFAPDEVKDLLALPPQSNDVVKEETVTEDSTTNPECLEEFLEELDNKQQFPQTIHISSQPLIPSQQAQEEPLPEVEENNQSKITMNEEQKPSVVLQPKQSAKTKIENEFIADDHRAQETLPNQILANNTPVPPSTHRTEYKQTAPIIPPHPLPSHTDHTDHSVTRILSFLKNVEQQPIQLQTSPHILSQIQGNHMGQSQSNPSVFDDVKQKIMASQLEIREKSKTIHVLQQELQRLKEAHQKDTIELQKSSRSQLSLQRKEYETIVKRHLSFIDNVLAEKETLSGRVVELTDKVTSLEKQFHQKATAMEESHLKNLSQQKELWQTQERIKRDKWIQDRTRQIKDQTIQGLEPEIQKLIATHKSALRNAEEEYRNRLQSEKTAMTEAFQTQLDKLREKHVADRQRACEEEREFARERYCKQLEREEMEFQQQKRKLQLEHEQSRLQWNQSTAAQLQDQAQDFKSQLASLNQKLSAQKQSHESHISQLESQRDKSIAELKSNLETQKEEWQALILKKTEAQVRAREKAFREQLIQERDAEIEVIIDRLERESGSSTSDATRRYRMDIERIKAETATEIKELRDQHSLALDKLLTSTTKISSLESEVRNLQKEVLKSSHALLAKESQVKSLKDQVQKLGGDESSVVCSLRREFEEQSEGLKHQIQSLQDSLAKEHEKTLLKEHEFNQNLEKVRKEKEETVQVLEKQVRISLASKDTAISTLKSSLDESNQKLKHLEHLMDQQRSELLGL